MKWIIAAALLLALTSLAQAADPAAPSDNALGLVTTYCWDTSTNTKKICGASGTAGATNTGITPVVTPSALANNLVIKASAGNLYSAYASNITGGSTGYLLIFDLAAAPIDGAVTPKVCVPLNGGVGSANYQGIPPAAFATGIVAVLSSATTCFTKTTGVITGFISGLAR